ncbi:MAG: efflux RND transporter periplasmic adaptor subunit [Phycisphaerales bacterium]|nr:MAG: efflux RND transporter periplasmic adaptor subunit [Phycisphaerales bacterium]
MQLITKLIVLPATITLAAVAGCEQASYAGGGHGAGSTDTHGGAHAHGDGEGPDPISVTLFTSKVQLFMEYPHLAKGMHASFLAHVTVLATGEPVRSGTLTFDLARPDGTKQNLTLDAPKRDGLFVPEWDAGAPGTYRLRLIVDSPQVQDTIDVGELIVHANEDAAFHAAEASAEPDPPDLVQFLLESQWKIGTLYEPVSKRTLVHRLPLPGRIVAPQGASAVVSPPFAGRLLRPASGRLPRIGDRVEAGQVLAMIEPQLPATEIVQLSANRAQVQSLETELALRELDLDTKALEVDRSLIQSEARLEFARRAMDRANELHEKGVGTDQQYDEATQALRLAEAEHEAAKAMKRSYEHAHERLVDLRSKALPSGHEVEPTTGVYQMPLVAPIAGEIVSVRHIEGEHLDAQQEVFRIVNVEQVWVEAEISEFDLTELAESPGATMTLPAYPGRSFDILNGGGGRLVNIASIVDPETRAVSVVYEMPNPDGLFRAGMFANVYLETRTARNVAALPEKAIVKDNGRPTAYVLVDGENFQRRELEVGVRDNGFVEVKGGVSEGERVVTKGAYAIKLASLSPASFGHGHGH